MQRSGSKKYLNRAIADETEAIKVYGKKPKGLNGEISKIRKDEVRHKRLLKKLKGKLF